MDSRGFAVDSRRIRGGFALIRRFSEDPHVMLHIIRGQYARIHRPFTCLHTSAIRGVNGCPGPVAHRVPRG